MKQDYICIKQSSSIWKQVHMQSKKISRHVMICIKFVNRLYQTTYVTCGEPHHLMLYVAKLSTAVYKGANFKELGNRQRLHFSL